jgi:hypothetical protein
MTPAPCEQGVIENITYASFGRPTGACDDDPGAMARRDANGSSGSAGGGGPGCQHPNSTAVVEKLCLVHALSSSK